MPASRIVILQGFLQYYEWGIYSFPQKTKMGLVRHLIIKFFKKKLPSYVSSENDLSNVVAVWQHDSCDCQSHAQIQCVPDHLLLGAGMP